MRIVSIRTRHLNRIFSLFPLLSTPLVVYYEQSTDLHYECSVIGETERESVLNGERTMLMGKRRAIVNKRGEDQEVD